MTIDINIVTRFIFFTLVPHFLFLYAFALGCCWPHYKFSPSLPGELGAVATPQQPQKSGRGGQDPVSGWCPLCSVFQSQGRVQTKMAHQLSARTQPKRQPTLHSHPFCWPQSGLPACSEFSQVFYQKLGEAV